MNLFIEVLSGAVTVVSLASAVVTAVKAKKAGQPIPWDKVRPSVIEAFKEVEGLITANKMGYQDVEDYVVAYVLNRVDASDLINPAEKAILGEGLIRSIVAPGLKELHDKLTAPVAPATPVEAPVAAPVEAPAAAPEQK